MDEVIFKKIKRTGVLNLAMGIVAVVAGITTGVLLIVSGAKLLAHKPDKLFDYERERK